MSYQINITINGKKFIGKPIYETFEAAKERVEHLKELAAARKGEHHFEIVEVGEQSTMKRYEVTYKVNNNVFSSFVVETNKGREAVEEYTATTIKKPKAEIVIWETRANPKPSQVIIGI